MALSSTSSTVTYSGNGSSVTPYSIPFPFLDTGDIFVSVNDGVTVEEIAGSEYVVVRLPDGSGGSLTTVEAYPAETEVTIFRRLELVQPTEYPPAGPFPAESFETALDRAVMQIQQLDAAIDRVPGATPPGITPAGGYLEEDPDTISGQDADGNLYSRDRDEMITFLDISDPGGAADRAEAAQAAAEDAVASIADYAFPGATDYTELRAMSGIVGTSRTLVGRGGGVFYWSADTITDDGGIFISATGGGTWVRQFDGPLSVWWYGADPTGVADSADAFDAALATGWNVYVPLGAYSCSRALEMNTTGQVLQGSGLSTSIINFTGVDTQAITYDFHQNPAVPPAPGAIPDSLQWAFIRDLRLRYTNAAPSTKRGFELLPRPLGVAPYFNVNQWNGEGCGLERVHIEGFHTGFYVEWASKFQLIHCHAKNCSAYGFWLGGSPNNCPRLETLTASGCDIGLYLDAPAGVYASLGDFALNRVGVEVYGGNCVLMCGELESYSECFLKARQNSEITIMGGRFLSRKVPIHAYDRSAVTVQSCTWAISGATQQVIAGDGTVGPFAISSVYYDAPEELTVYLTDTAGDNLRRVAPRASYILTGDGSAGSLSGMIEFLVPVPATTNITVTITQAIGEQFTGTANIKLVQGTRFRYSNIDDFGSQREGRVKLLSEEIITVGDISYGSLLSSVINPDNIGMLAFREPEMDLQLIAKDINGDPINYSLTKNNLPSRTIGAGTVYSNGKEHFVRKDGGQFVLLNPSNLLYGASPVNARQIIIRNTNAGATMTLGRNSGATLMNGVAANIVIPANGACTAITCGDDDEWTVLLHAS